MPRKETAASERIAQMHRTQAVESARAGRPVGVREAARLRKEQNAAAPPAGFLMEDRSVNVEGREMRRVGQVLAKVTDLKQLRGAMLSLNLETDLEFGHLLMDAARISNGRYLLVTLDEISIGNG